MEKEFLSLQNEVDLNKSMGKFDVVIIGVSDKIFLDTFSLILNNPNIYHKFLNSYDLILRDQIKFPSDFINIYHPEIMDKLMNIDILILSYDIFDIISFENIKTFYKLYYKKLEEKDRPNNVIIIERIIDYDDNKEKESKKDKFNIIEGKKMAELYNGIFCDYNINIEEFEKILDKCINNLKEKYNNENYSLFKSKIKNQSKNINCHISIYGDNYIQNLFLKYLLKLKCNEDYEKKNDGRYIINFKCEENNKNINIKIIIELMKDNDYCYDSQSNIFLYDLTKKETFNNIKNLIRAHI